MKSTDDPGGRASRIGILGGTFNPIHTGHLVAAEEVGRDFNLDRVLLIPANLPPLKERAGVITSEHRIRMVSLAARSNPRLEARDLEIRRGGVSYTIDTVRALIEETGFDQSHRARDGRRASEPRRCSRCGFGTTAFASTKTGGLGGSGACVEPDVGAFGRARRTHRSAVDASREDRCKKATIKARVTTRYRAVAVAGVEHGEDYASLSEDDSPFSALIACERLWPLNP